MVNIERTSVLLRCFPAMSTHFISLADFFGALHPEGKIFNVARKLSHGFTKIVIDILSLIPFNLAFARTKASTVFLASATAQFASWKRFAGRVHKTFAATVDRSIIPELRLEQLAAGRARFGRRLARANSITRLRAILGLVDPFGHRYIRVLGERRFANYARLFHNDNYTMTQSALQGNTMGKTPASSAQSHTPPTTRAVSCA